MGKTSEEDQAMMRNMCGFCVVTIFILNFSGCANTQPTHFYLLRAMETASGGPHLETKNSGISLGLGPIKVPKYLDRPQIVTRISSHEINLAEFHKWAEPIKDNLSNVLQENLLALLATDRIVLYPWNRSSLPDYQLSLDVVQLDGRKNQEAVFKVRWTLARDDGRQVLRQQTSQFSEISRGSGYEDLIEAMSRMLTTFSQEVVESINARSSSTPKMRKSKIDQANPFK